MALPNPPRLRGNLIADTSIRQPIFILMIMLLALVVGGLAYVNLPVNLLPDIDVPTVAVTLPYPGANAESVVDQVVRPVEDQLETLSGVKHVTANASEGAATLVIEFESTVNVNQALQDVRDKVNATLPRLPHDLKTPIYQKFDPNQQPILSVAITAGGGRSPLQLRTLVDDEIVPRLEQVSGVGAVTSSGGQIRQINVLMNGQQLAIKRLVPAQLAQALDAANASQSLGTIHTGGQDFDLRAPSMLTSPDDISLVQITGTPYRVGDVATVQDGTAEDSGYARLNGEDAVVIDVRRQSGTNLVQVVDAVRTQMTGLFARYPDLHYTIVSDQSTRVRESVDGSIEELVIAVIAAMLVVLLFFRDLRNTLVTVIGLPVILIASFAAMAAFGITLNLISLLALSVSVGLVIDDAIVVRENIFRHMERGESPMVAASRGTAQVALSVLAMTLTLIAVFLPVAFTGGVTGIIFKAFGITAASAMALSLIEAFTLAPMLSARLFKGRAVPVAPAGGRPRSAAAELLAEAGEDPGRLGRFYARVLGWGLRHRLVVVGVAVLVFVASAWVAGQLKFAFIPALDSHDFVVAFELPPGSPLSATDAAARQVEAILRRDPDVIAVQASVGGETSPERASFHVLLQPHALSLPVETRLRPQLAFLPNLAVTTPSIAAPSTGITARDVQLSVQTTRPLNEIVPQVQQLLALAHSQPVLTDIDLTYKPGRPEINVQADPAKAGAYGYTNRDLTQSVRALINGTVATTLHQNGQDVDVVIRLPADQRNSVASVEAIEVPTAAGNVPLTSLARVTLDSGPTVLRRYDRQNQVLIGANVQGANANAEIKQLQAGIDALHLPADVTTRFVGSQQMLNEGFTSLILAMGLSVLFVYMVLASQFGSLWRPLVIMLAMPFSFIGAFLALLISGIDLSVIGMIGLIMLLGLVVKNSILLIDFTGRLQSSGLPTAEALVRAGGIRLRPILMTTTALIGGALPSVIGLGAGVEIRRPLAVVIIGGLITSLVLTLLVVPVVYSLVDAGLARLGRRRSVPAPVTPTPAAPPRPANPAPTITPQENA